MIIHLSTYLLLAALETVSKEIVKLNILVNFLSYNVFFGVGQKLVKFEVGGFTKLVRMLKSVQWGLHKELVSYFAVVEF